MDFQSIVVAVVILAALAYIGRRVWRKINSFSEKSSCGIGCGCGK